MLEREEEEARSLIFCPLVEMTPCRHRILRYVDVAERRICEIPGPAQSLTSKSPYYPEYQVNEGWWEGHHLLQGLEAHLLFLILEERSDCAIPWIVSRDELLSNISAIDSSFEHPRTKRDLRDGGRLPTSRDSSVAVLVFAASMALRETLDLMISLTELDSDCSTL
ncbi:hypothetical protein CUMW_133510 [Citrus unshiu]|nr:hypothetical protein CUMW_133510 [Citrus unshiu]